jgi:hypothetical protein
MRLIDLTGKRVGKLVVIERRGKIGSKAAWHCLCDCGNYHLVSADVLQSERTKSCGCHKIAVDTRGTRYRHGMSASSEHKIWCGMKERCSNPNSAFFSHYGGRSIGVCDRWSVFENFYADMGQRPSKAYTLDRVDNDKGYEPANCRWATNEQQANNTRKNVMIVIGDEARSLAQWSRHFGVDSDLASQRIIRDGWNPERAVSTKSIRR